MIEIEIYIDRLELLNPGPDGLADLLGYALIIPTPGTAQVPLGMISPKLVHLFGSFLIENCLQFGKPELPLPQQGTGKACGVTCPETFQ